ncbi:MAG: insulinase family protein [Planctomycetota bacterium]|nr:insulinase family protein [Planctomycetota bacterium]
MTEQTIQAKTLDNGLVVIVEPMAGVRSAAFSFLLPAGSVFDPPGKNAAAAVLCEMLPRGAGSRDSREFSNALDDLGVQRDESVGVAHLSMSGAMIADNLDAALRLYRDLIREPHLPAEEFEPAQAGVAQTIRGNEDEPRQKVVTELRQRCFEVPWGLPSDGTLTGLESLSHDDIVGQYRSGVRPNGAILGIAGAIDPAATLDLVAELFGDWPAVVEPAFELGPRGSKRDHIEHDSTQTHIGISYEAIPYAAPDYYAAWAAVNVLSGGMSARLFTEVREKRGLCYAVSASLTSLKHAGQVLCYAGTTNERAQQTLDVTLHELRRLGEGIDDDELDRCKAGAKSALIMQQESTRSRAGSLARDWYHLGRVRPLAEVRREIESLTTDRVLDYVHAHPADDVTILTLGPKPLEG